MYVLQHADKPEIYNDLPKDPSISAMVSLWKDGAKPLATFALAAGVFGAFIHYVTKGPNEVSEETEKEFNNEK
jgi:formate dehydrogenase iron-sulfur subunit